MPPSYKPSPSVLFHVLLHFFTPFLRFCFDGPRPTASHHHGRWAEKGNLPLTQIHKEHTPHPFHHTRALHLATHTPRLPGAFSLKRPPAPTEHNLFHSPVLLIPINKPWTSLSRSDGGNHPCPSSSCPRSRHGLIILRGRAKLMSWGQLPPLDI